MIVDDYKYVFQSMAQDAKARPFWTALKVTLVGGAWGLFMTNPELSDYKNRIQECTREIALLSPQERNEEVSQHFTRASDLIGRSCVKRIDLYLCSVFLENEQSLQVTMHPYHWDGTCHTDPLTHPYTLCLSLSLSLSLYIYIYIYIVYTFYPSIYICVYPAFSLSLSPSPYYGMIARYRNDDDLCELYVIRSLPNIPSHRWNLLMPNIGHYTRLWRC